MRLQYIDISLNSKFQVIEKEAFFSTNIKSFYIPSSVNKIDVGAFDFCNNLLIVEIGENSQLKSIEKNIFGSNLRQIKIMILQENKINLF